MSKTHSFDFLPEIPDFSRQLKDITNNILENQNNLLKQLTSAPFESVHDILNKYLTIYADAMKNFNSTAMLSDQIKCISTYLQTYCEPHEKYLDDIVSDETLEKAEKTVEKVTKCFNIDTVNIYNNASQPVEKDSRFKKIYGIFSFILLLLQIITNIRSCSQSQEKEETVEQNITINNYYGYNNDDLLSFESELEEIVCEMANQINDSLCGDDFQNEHQYCEGEALALDCGGPSKPQLPCDSCQSSRPNHEKSRVDTVTHK